MHRKRSFKPNLDIDNKRLINDLKNENLPQDLIEIHYDNKGNELYSTIKLTPINEESCSSSIDLNDINKSYDDKSLLMANDNDNAYNNNNKNKRNSVQRLNLLNSIFINKNIEIHNNNFSYSPSNKRSIIVPKISNDNGHINPAYEQFNDNYDEASNVDSLETIITDDNSEQQQQQQQNSKPLTKNVSFKTSKKSNNSKIENENDNNNNNNDNQSTNCNNNNKNNESTGVKNSNNNMNGKDKLPEWDRFVTEPPPDEDETQKSEWVEVAIRWLKLFAYFFTFIMVLLLSVFSKTTILLMTSMVNVDHQVSICNDDSYEIEPPLDHDKEYYVIYQKDSIPRIGWLWSLYFAAISPYFFAFGRSIRIVYFKTFKYPSVTTMITVFIAETIHCIGLSIFLFILLPEMDVIRGAMMMNSVCFLPTIIRLLVDRPKQSQTSLEKRLSLSTDETTSVFEDEFDETSDGQILAEFDHLKLAYNRWLAWINFILQIIVIICWTAICGYDHYKYGECEHFYLLPIAMILVSFEWWENYVVPDSMKKISEFLSDVKNDLSKSRYFVFSFISIWKILLIFLLMLLNEFHYNGSDTTTILFKNFTDSFDYGIITVIRDKNRFENNFKLETDEHRLYVETAFWPLFMLLIHVSITYLSYAFAKFTCKVCFQSISFAIPLCLTIPCTVSLLWAMNSIALQDKCKLVKIFKPFQYIFWNVQSEHIFKLTWYNTIVSIIWLISFINQVLNTLHIWKETSERLASTEQLFVSPMYNTVFIDQSLTMNRRCLKLIYAPEDEDRNDDIDDNKNIEQSKIESKDDSVKLVVNATSVEASVQELPTKTYEAMNEWNDHVNRIINNKSNENNENDDDWTKDWQRVCEMMGVEEDSIDAKTDPDDDETIRIYICATMWHEDQNEMFQMLKAVMRLDYEQGLRRIAKKEFGDAVKKTIYEMEVNIYFDDAFEQGKSDDEDDRIINRFVEQLIDTIGGSANQVFGKNLDLEPPTIVPTPYGGKLIWKMPMGTNRLVAHIKDKNLIRHRKRWSQCMYMYYLLGYRLAAREDLDAKRKKTIMNNTFVLALDGDINFRPAAVDLVVDLMRKNNNLGAACGRIHPIGSGPIVWYQKFEYAMGHWLQKATEHVIGCVLCSPGCFSLFRARALMDKSIMNKYTTKPTQARHYVQYDQGEDRWLCTLLLQRGWRIEYCAASDSYTHAPEGFAEFYTQRRRWGPSTMANILDLLGDYKRTVKMNDNISNLYIIYQGFLMLGTIISPGTIFLMVVSAMNTVMGLTTEMSLVYNMIPLLLFLFVCLKFKDNDIKINFATILSVIYALLMLAVLVGTGIDMYTKGFFSPNALFFSAMMLSFIVAAILHPQEFACVLPLPIYMLFIPSMYMLLTIYSITNMNVVSWGTREVKSKLSAKELQKQKEEEEARAKAASAKKKGKFLNFDSIGSTKNGLFTCMCCSGSNDNDFNLNQSMGSDIKDIKQQMNQMNEIIFKEFKNNNKNDYNPHNEVHGKSQNDNNDNNADKNANNEQQQPQDNGNGNEQEQGINENNIINNNDNGDDQRRSTQTTCMKQKPRWVRNNERLNSWPIRFISDREEEFWKKMIKKYLYPLDEDLKEKERISLELADLRNKFVFAFSFLNIIFILFVFMLQIHKDVFGIDVPVGTNGTSEIHHEEEDRIEYVTNIVYTRMDPINLTLVIFFGAILIIQCIGMFIHRFGTLAHLLAYTEIHEKKKQIDYSSLVAQLVKENSKKLRRKRRRLRRLTSNNNNNNNNHDNNNDTENLVALDTSLITDDDEDDDDDDGDDKASSKSSYDDLKPSDYANVFGKVMQKLKSNESEIEKMPKIMRKNTIQAIRTHEHHQRCQLLQNRLRRDSSLSTNGITNEHRRLSRSNSIQQSQHPSLCQRNSLQSDNHQQQQQQRASSIMAIDQQPLSVFISQQSNMNTNDNNGDEMSITHF